MQQHNRVHATKQLFKQRSFDQVVTLTRLCVFFLLPVLMTNNQTVVLCLQGTKYTTVQTKGRYAMMCFFYVSFEVCFSLCVLAYVHVCHLSPGRGIGSAGNAWLAECSEAGVVHSFELSPAVEHQTHSCPYSLEP